jgi:hypothetical protein
LRIFNEILYNSNVGSFTSKSLKIDNIFGYSIQCVFTGNPMGMLSLRGSSDSVQLSMSPQNWDTINGSSQAITNSGTTTYNVVGAFYNYVQIIYSDTSGGTAIGSCTITGNSKGI